MSKYIELKTALERLNQLYHGYEVEEWLNSLPTIEIDEKEERTYKYFYEQGKFDAYMEAEVCGDAISRAEVLDEFRKDYDDIVDLMTAIEELPSVVPKQSELTDVLTAEAEI